MYNQLLEEKPKNNIEKKLKYWIQIWNELINNFNKNSFGLKFENVHTIIEELLEEIEFNHLQNTLNKKFFIEKLGKILKEDIVIKNNFNLEIKNLIENLNSDKNEYINVICINIDRNIFKSKKYISLLLKNIKEIIINEDEKNYNDIKNLTKSIIIEFIMLKYNTDYIKLIIQNIFDTYIEYDGHVVTNLPINSDLDNDKLKAYINNLSIGDRIDLIDKYIEKESEELYIICRLNGFKAVNELICGDVEFYNPKFKNHIAISNFISDEEIREQYENWNSENIVNIPHYYNAIVKVKAKTNYQAFKEAERKIELVFNTIRCCYPSEYKFSLCKENYYILDKEKNFIGESSSLPKNYHDEYEFYRENDDTFIPQNQYLQDILKAFSQFMYNDSKEYNETQRKIIASLGGFRKANENEKLEEKLLNYWICIENLMNIKTEKNKNLIINKGEESVFTLAREIIPSFYISHSTKTFFQELYYYIYIVYV